MPVSRRQVALGGGVAVVAAAAMLASPDRVLSAAGSLVASPWFPVVLVGLYLVRPFLAWPITVLSALVGYRYGPLLGFPVAIVGAVLTSLVPYYLAGRLDTDGWLLGNIRAGGERYFEAAGDVRGVVAARLVPTPAEAISGAAGVARVPVPAFVLGTVVGETPWTVAAVLLGASLDDFASGAVHVDLRLVVVLAAVAAALLAGPAYRVLHRR